MQTTCQNSTEPCTVCIMHYSFSENYKNIITSEQGRINQKCILCAFLFVLSVVTRAHDIVSRGHGLVSRAHDLVTRVLHLVSRAHDLVTRAHDIV